MTVKDMIEKLQEMPQDLDILISDGDVIYTDYVIKHTKDWVEYVEIGLEG